MLLLLLFMVIVVERKLADLLMRMLMRMWMMLANWVNSMAASGSGSVLQRTMQRRRIVLLTSQKGELVHFSREIRRVRTIINKHFD